MCAPADGEARPGGTVHFFGAAGPRAADDCAASDPNGTACDDGLVCGAQDACSLEICVSGSPIDCDDCNARSADSYDSRFGCGNAPIDYGDQDECTADGCDFEALGVVA